MPGQEPRHGPAIRSLATMAIAAFMVLMAIALGLRAVAGPNPTPLTTPDPPEAPKTGRSINVNSIQELRTALTDDGVGEIVVADGTYNVDVASSRSQNSLWIGADAAARTTPVLVRAETRGGVVIDGGGARHFGGITFADGSHDQTWDGFTFANGEATDTGVIVFGGVDGAPAPHHITLRAIAIDGSATGHNDRNDHGVYFSYASGGPHDILIDGLIVDGTGAHPLATALHFFHSNAGNQNAWNTTIRRLKVDGTFTAISMWDASLHNVRIESALISGARYGAVQVEFPGREIVFSEVTSRESGAFGFYSSAGMPPPGVSIIASSFE